MKHSKTEQGRLPHDKKNLSAHRTVPCAMASPTTYSFSYGDFGMAKSVSIGSKTLASYTYTNYQDRYLKSLDYGNEDSVEYEYDDKGRVTTEIHKDLERNADGDEVETQETVEYLYNNDGNLAKVIDSATGRTTTYFYDFTDRLTKYVEEGTDYYHSVSYAYSTGDGSVCSVDPSDEN